MAVSKERFCTQSTCRCSILYVLLNSSGAMIMILLYSNKFNVIPTLHVRAIYFGLNIRVIYYIVSDSLYLNNNYLFSMLGTISMF